LKYLAVSFLLFYIIFSNGDLQGQWIQTNGPFAGSIATMAVNTNGYLYAGTNRAGIFRSTNNGNNWSQINNGLLSLSINTIVCNSFGKVFASDGGKVYSSSD
jgi:ligand-binding sensor domain-containing protein